MANNLDPKLFPGMTNSNSSSTVSSTPKFFGIRDPQTQSNGSAQASNTNTVPRTAAEVTAQGIAKTTPKVATPATSSSVQTKAASTPSVATNQASSATPTAIPTNMSAMNQFANQAGTPSASTSVASQTAGLDPTLFPFGFNGQYSTSYSQQVSTTPVAETPATVAAPSSGANAEAIKLATDYLNEYNANREQKIRDMYAGNLNSQNAGYKTALDKNLDALKTAYDANLGNLRTAYDNNTGSLKTAYDANTGTLRTAYDTNIANLENAYLQNLSDAEAARAQISPRYQESMNSLSAEYERQRRNDNMQAAVNGINTGTGSQMQLGQSMAYQRNQGNLARSENEALNEAERGINDLGRNYRNQQNILNTEYNNNLANLDTRYANETDRLNREYQNNLNTYSTTYQNNLASMKTNYENQIAQAAANNDYQLAAALLDEYGNQYDRMQTQAALLAEFGDFSAYADMYGQTAADTLRKNWALRNPQIAWASGNLSAEDYYALTGEYPHDPNEAVDSTFLPGLSAALGYNVGGGKTGYYNGVTAATPAQETQPTGSTYNDFLSYMPLFGSGSYSGGGGSSSGGGGSAVGGYTGPAGYYNTAGNFVVPSTGSSYGSATGSDKYDKTARSESARKYAESFL